MKLITQIMLCLLIVAQAHHVFSSAQEGVPIITVLPFEVSEEGEYAYLNKAIDQMLLARLSRYQDLKVVAALDGDRDQIPPETVQLIEENLRVIDEAIRHSPAALEATPQSLPLQQAVMTSYERKLDFLRQATALTAEG